MNSKDKRSLYSLIDSDQKMVFLDILDKFVDLDFLRNILTYFIRTPNKQTGSNPSIAATKL